MSEFQLEIRRKLKKILHLVSQGDLIPHDEARKYTERPDSWKIAIDHIYSSLEVFERKIDQIERPVKKARIRRGYSYRQDILTSKGREFLEGIVTFSVVANSVAVKVHDMFNRSSLECFDTWISRISLMMDSLLGVPSFRRRCGGVSRVSTSKFAIFRKTVVESVIRQVSLDI